MLRVSTQQYVISFAIKLRRDLFIPIFRFGSIVPCRIVALCIGCQNHLQFIVSCHSVPAEFICNWNSSFKVFQLHRKCIVFVISRRPLQDTVYHEIQIRMNFADRHLINIWYWMTISHIFVSQLISRIKVVVEVIPGVPHTKGKVINVLEKNFETTLISSEIGCIPQWKCWFQRSSAHLQNNISKKT